MTGKSPGRHGVFDFFKKDSQGRRQLVSSQDIDGPTLWRYLSDHGRHCIVLNVPCTYPPESISGIVVSGMLTPADAEYVNPPETSAALDAWTGGYRVNPRSEYVGSPFDRDELIRELREVTEIQKCAFLQLLERESWDFAMLMFRATDVIQHKLWHRPEDVAQVYRMMDLALSEIVAAAGDSSIWLMSDHGFGPLYKLFHINRWLRDRGWLAIQRKTTPKPRESEETGRAGISSHASVLRRLASRFGLSREWARSALSPSVQSVLKGLLPGKMRRWVPSSSYEVDWSRTQVYNDSSFTQETQALRINLKGREPQGTVEADDFDRLRQEVIEGLQAIRDTQTGEPVIIRVHRGDELFAGPYAAKAPDLVLQLRDGYKMISDFIAQEWVSSLSPVGGCHRRAGVFAAWGPDIARGEDLGQLSIADLMPTLLHYMGLAVPSACDGNVRRDVFAAQSKPATRAVRYDNASATRPTEPKGAAKDDEEVLSRLRALGYIE
jgi:predicted AlkP superfamily phosphohydrolase/phosphomutase